MEDIEEEIPIKKETKEVFMDLSSLPHSESGEEVKYSDVLIKRDDMKFNESKNILIEENFLLKDNSETKLPMLTSLVKDCSVRVCKSDVSLYINKLEKEKTDLETDGEEAMLHDYEDSQQNETENDEDDYQERDGSGGQEGDFKEFASLKRLSQSCKKTKVKKKYVKERKFVCKTCGKGFPQSDILRRHIRTHTGERPYECSYCCKRFISKTFLKRHLTNHTGKRYRCLICDKRFMQSQGLKTHMLIHEGKKPFKCSHCGKEFRQKCILIRHIRRSKDHYHGNEDMTRGNRMSLSSETIESQQSVQQHTTAEELDILECADCGKTFKSKQYILDHVKSIHSYDKATCEHCGKVFKSKSSIVEHLKSAHSVERIKYCCQICGFASSSKSNLKLHERVHDNIYPFKCNICKMSFKQKLSLISHLMQTHESIRPFKCEDCGSTFKLKINLKSHIEVHHNQSDAIFQCKICLMEFKRKCYLKRHSEIHTGADKKYACHICSVRCRSKTDITLHVRTHFNNVVKNHSCDVCGARFAKPSHLVRHKRVHSDVKIFQCQLCDKAYKDTSSLKIHQETVHCRASFSCHGCGWSSTNRHSFKRHLRKCLIND